MAVESMIADFLHHHPVARTLTESQLNRLCGLMDLEILGADATIVEEESLSCDLYFLVDGEVSLLQWDAEKQHQLSVGRLGKGEMFGEMSFVDGRPRTLTVRTNVPSILLRLPHRGVIPEDAEMKEIYYRILSNIAFLSRNRLRRTNQDYVRSLRKRIEQLNLQNHFGRFVVLWIVLMGGGTVLNALTILYQLPWESAWYNWGYLVGFGLIPCGLLMHSFGLSWSDVGVTWKNGPRSIIEGIFFSCFSVALLALGYYVYARFHPSVPSLLHVVLHPISSPALVDASIIYVASAYLQELVMRGFSQTPLKKFWSSTPHAALKAILIVAFIFALVHFQRGIGSTLVVFLASLIFGFVYDRHQNLLGVSIMHYVWGVVGIWYLGIV